MQIKRLKSLSTSQVCSLEPRRIDSCCLIDFILVFKNKKGGEAQIQAMTWSPNNLKFAFVSADRVIHLFDDNGEQRDKFATKPCDAKVFIDCKTSYEPKK